MNVACSVPLSGAIDTTLICAALLACKQYGVRAPIVTPRGLGVLGAGWLAQAAFSTRANSIWESNLLVIVIGIVTVSVFTDLATGYIFDSVTLPGLGLALIIGMIDGHLTQIAEGALLLSGSIVLLHALSRGRGIGLGDAKLAACVGALLGAKSGLRSLGFAFVLGGMYATIVLLCRRARSKQSVPFAPYLAAGALIELALQTA